MTSVWSGQEWQTIGDEASHGSTLSLVPA